MLNGTIILIEMTVNQDIQRKLFSVKQSTLHPMTPKTIKHRVKHAMDQLPAENYNITALRKWLLENESIDLTEIQPDEVISDAD